MVPDSGNKQAMARSILIFTFLSLEGLRTAEAETGAVMKVYRGANL